MIKQAIIGKTGYSWHVSVATWCTTLLSDGASTLANSSRTRTVEGEQGTWTVWLEKSVAGKYLLAMRELDCYKIKLGIARLLYNRR
jgi:hypothetical protein